MHLSLFLTGKIEYNWKETDMEEKSREITTGKRSRPKLSIRLIFRTAISVWILHWASTKPFRQPTPSASQFIFLMTAFNDREIWCLKPSHLCGLFPQIPYFPSKMPPQKKPTCSFKPDGWVSNIKRLPSIIESKKLHCNLVNSWSSRAHLIFSPSSYL